MMWGGLGGCCEGDVGRVRGCWKGDVGRVRWVL